MAKLGTLTCSAVALCAFVGTASAQVQIQHPPPAVDGITAIPTGLPRVATYQPTAGAPTWTVYSLFEYVHLDYVFPNRNFSSDRYQSINGVNVAVTPWFTIGGGVIFGWSDNDLAYLPGHSDSVGAVPFVNAAWNVQNLFTLGAAAGIGRYNTDQTRFIGPVVSTGSYDSDTWFASAWIQRDFQYGNWFITPRARVLWSVIEDDSFVESTGILNPSARSTLGQFAVGGQIAYAIPAGNIVWYPLVEANFLYDFDLPNFQSDRTAVDLKLGINAAAGNFAFGAAYMTILGRDEYDEYHGVRAFVSYHFPPAVAAPAAPAIVRKY